MFGMLALKIVAVTLLSRAAPQDACVAAACEIGLSTDVAASMGLAAEDAAATLALIGQQSDDLVALAALRDGASETMDQARRLRVHLSLDPTDETAARQLAAAETTLKSSRRDGLQRINSIWLAVADGLGSKRHYAVRRASNPQSGLPGYYFAVIADEQLGKRTELARISEHRAHRMSETPPEPVTRLLSSIRSDPGFVAARLEYMRNIDDVENEYFGSNED